MEIESGLCASCANYESCSDKMSDVLNCTSYVNDPSRKSREDLLSMIGQLTDRITELEMENATLSENQKRKPGRPRKTEQ